MIFLVYLYLIVFIIFDIFILAVGIEQLLCAFRKIAPKVPSGRQLRVAVAEQIAIEMPDVKSIIDVGSGWGTMVRTVAKKFPNAKVYGIEFMPSAYVYSVVRGLFVWNAKLIFGNAFKYLEQTDKKFDVGITYLLPSEMNDVKKFMAKFKMLFVLDFPLPDVTPIKKIKLNKNALGQHWLYVYKS